MEIGIAYDFTDVEMIQKLLEASGISLQGAEGNRTVGYQIFVEPDHAPQAIDLIKSCEAFQRGKVLFLFENDERLVAAERAGFDGFLKWRSDCHELRHGLNR